MIPTWTFTAVELTQAVVGLLGFAGALAEARATLVVQRDASASPRRRLIASHQAFIEHLRLVVHVIVIGVAILALSLPSPPDLAMAHYQPIILTSKIGMLVIAIIACVGTWASRRARHRAWALAHPQE